MPHVTATTLYDPVRCLNRVEPDYIGDQANCGPIRPFAAMFWMPASLYEQEVIESSGLTYLASSVEYGEEKERLPPEAMQIMVTRGFMDKFLKALHPNLHKLGSIIGDISLPPLSGVNIA